MNVTSLNHLALFICHLLIDGHFRTTHFLYNPNTFDSDLLLQIDDVCPESIPLYLTDITLPWKWPWNNNDNSNNVLQLNFFGGLNNLTENIDELKRESTYYRVFCFSSNDAIDTTIRSLFGSKTLIVYYNTENVSIFIDSDQSNEKLIHVVNYETNYQRLNLFDRTFGEFERTQSIAIQRIIYIDKTLHGVYFKSEYSPAVIWMHYYHMHLNNTFINVTWIDIKESPHFQTNQYCLLQSSDYYKETVSEYQCSRYRNALINDHSSVSLHVSPSSLRYTQNYEHTKILYPYHSRELKSIFIYGTDHKRTIDIFRVSNSVKIVTALILSLLITAVIVLYTIRRRFNLPGDEIVSCILDCLILFIGGGNLRMEHRLERRFFGILLAGTFFIVSVFGGDLVDSVVRILNSKIKTFEDLTELNSSIAIYLDPELVANTNDISGMLTTKMGTQHDDLKWIILPDFFEIKTSCLVVLSPNDFDLTVALLDIHKRDYDILEESLGEILDRYTLTSHQFISERMVRKFDKTTNSMAEHGFYQFCHSHFDFALKWLMIKLKMTIRSEYNFEVNLEPITIEQLRKPIIIVLCLNGIATIIFVAEILIFKWLKWRNCSVQILPLVEKQFKLRSNPMPSEYILKRCHSAPSKMTETIQRNTKRPLKKCRSAHI